MDSAIRGGHMMLLLIVLVLFVLTFIYTKQYVITLLL